MLAQLSRRSTQQLLLTSQKRFQSTVAPVKKSSSFRGILFGFFAGVSITGFGAYYYLMDEYKSSSNAVVSDVLLLQKSIRKLEGHVRVLEENLKK